MKDKYTIPTGMSIVFLIKIFINLFKVKVYV